MLCLVSRPAVAQTTAPGQTTSSPTTSPSLPSTPLTANQPSATGGVRSGNNAGLGADPTVTYPSLPASLAVTTPGAIAIRPGVEQVIVLVTRRNPGLLAILKDVFSARAGVRAAQPLAPPNLFIAPSLTPGGVSDGFIYEQPLELNGTRTARVQVARAGVDVARAQAIVQLQAIVYTARQNYYALARAQAQLALAQDYLALAQEFDRGAQRQVELGARPGIERTQTAIEVSRARIQAAQLGGEEQAARSAFNAYLGRAPLDPVAPLDALNIPEVSVSPAPALDLVDAQRQALAHRAEIALVAANRDVQIRLAQLDRAEGRPDLALQLRAGDFAHGARDAGIGAVFTIPLDYGTRRERVRQETLNAHAQEDRLTGVRSQVRLDVLQAAGRLEAAQLNLQIYSADLLGNARKALDETRLGFQEGRSSILGVLEAQRTFRSLSGERANALGAYAQTQADLDRALGRVPPDLLAVLLKDFDGKDAAHIKTIDVNVNTGLRDSGDASALPDTTRNNGGAGANIPTDRAASTALPTPDHNNQNSDPNSNKSRKPL